MIGFAKGWMQRLDDLTGKSDTTRSKVLRPRVGCAAHGRADQDHTCGTCPLHIHLHVSLDCCGASLGCPH